jgi:prepilin signal peptidase PulO-like enzyme (type II secretory pathway)
MAQKSRRYMRKILSNIYLVILLYFFYFLLQPMVWGSFDYQALGSGIGALISPFVIMCLIRSYNKVGNKEFLGGIALIGLIFSVLNLLGFLTIVGGISTISLIWLILRRIQLLFIKKEKKDK